MRGGEADWLCDALERSRSISEYLLDRAPAWLGDGFEGF
jgi:hypothetical protein